jgi:drug/metabolite transporter (DMT)-like permease
MIPVILHIISASLFSLIYKISVRRGNNYIVTATSMFVSGFLITFLILVFTNSFNFNFLVFILGISGGICIYFAVLSFFYSLRYGFLSVSWAIVSLSIVLPVFVSMFFWNETCGLYQIIGILFIITAFIFSSQFFSVRGDNVKYRWLFYLLCSFLCSGTGQVISKALVQYQLEDFKYLYLFYNYLSAGLLGIIVIIVKRFKIRMKECFWGGLMGLLGFITIVFMILSLTRIRAVIFFPIKGAGSLILTAVFTWFVWHERLNKSQLLAITAAVLAIVFISLK